MNTDFLIFNETIRDDKYKKNINTGSKNNDTRFYSDSCDTIGTFAKEQNTIYNPLSNQILYGINANMHVLGVSDGTCNQINPTIYTPNYICGTGTAGGNRCYAKSNQIENFKSNENNCNGINVTTLITCLILIFLLIGVFYIRTRKN